MAADSNHETGSLDGPGFRIALLPHTPSPPPSARRVQPWPSRRALAIAILLFLLSLATTATLGAVWTLLARTDVETDLEPVLTPATVVAVWSDPQLRRSGLEFALPALFILLCHEMGHWIACRRHGLPATLPYFLPGPVGLGTFGAFIRIRAPVRSKAQLLDVGVWGPLAGFVALLPILAAGVALSHPTLPTAATIPPGLELDLYRPGESLLLLGLVHLFHGGLPAGSILQPHPLLLAGWFGLFATMLNLLPLSQLDGGHIFYAASGARQRRWAWPLWGALALLGFAWPGWWVWSVIVLVMRVRHPRVVDEASPLDLRRKLLAGAALAVFVLGFMPVPIRVERLVAVRSGGSIAAGVAKIQDQRHRPVVGEDHLHVGAEAAALDGNAELAQPADERPEALSGKLRSRRAFERRTAAARGRGEQGEIRNHEHRAPGLPEVQVEPTPLVREDAETGDFIGGSDCDLVVVSALDPNERDQPRADRREPLATDLDPGPRNALQDDAHVLRPFYPVMRPERAAMIATAFEESERC